MAFLASVGPGDATSLAAVAAVSGSGSSSSSTGVTTAGGTGGPTSPTKKGMAPAFEGNKKLMEQVEYLRQEQRKQENKFSEERKNLQLEMGTKLMTQERQLKQEIAQLRVRVVELEDQASHRDEELMTAKSHVDSLQAMCRQMEQARAEAVSTQNKLRGDLKNMQQSGRPTHSN